MMLLLLFHALPSVADTVKPPIPDSVAIARTTGRWVGEWSVVGTTQWFGPEAVISSPGPGMVQITSDKGRFAAVGLFDGAAVHAIAHDRTGKFIQVRITRKTDDELTLEGEGECTSYWGLVTMTRITPAVRARQRQLLATQEASTAPARDPAFGEYVYVEELPEAVTKVQPAYDRSLGIEGTVMVQALVGADGLVKDTKVVKSIPPLDAAAVAAVKQWRFQPARTKGQPVAVWVAVPVRFSSH